MGRVFGRCGGRWRLLLLALMALLASCGYLYPEFFGFSAPDAASVTEKTPLVREPVAPLVATTPEAELQRIVAEIEAGRLDAALTLTDALLQEQPNFRLAHLIRGDLLLAKAQPLPAFGAAANAPAERIADLHAEALARLAALKSPPAPERIPRYLLQLAKAERYAIVIDTSRSRLYLFHNDNGTPRLEADYYISQGKLGAEKLYEGDKRTPLGTYRITRFVPDEKLPDLYGHGAFPLNYPNVWDKRRGRGGSGIWLHGTPSDTYSRPPKASDGCVVLTNPDFDRLGEKVQTGLTPVIISGGIDWRTPAEVRRERDELLARLEAWRADWESRDIDRYLAYYAEDFQANGQDRAAFARQKRAVNRDKTWIRVQLEQISLLRDPGPDNLAVVSFVQDYASNNLSNHMTKRQYWQKQHGVWKIVHEGGA